MRRTQVVSCLLWAAAFLSAQNARADEQSPETGWRFDVGAGVLASPVFPGAKHERVLPLPSIEAHYGDRFFASIREGIGYNILVWKGLRAGPVANIAFPRDESDERSALNGLGDVDLTFEVGGVLKYDLGLFASAKVEARQGVNGHQGLIVDTSIDLNAPPIGGNRLFLSAGPRFSYYDQRYAQAYYGVSSLQASRSGYAIFRPADGEKAGVAAAAVYLVTARIALTAFGNYGRLLGDVGDSPIVRGPYGCRDQLTLGAFVSYRFDLGD